MKLSGFFILSFWAIILTGACGGRLSGKEALLRVIVSETAGIPRDSEYVEISFQMPGDSLAALPRMIAVPEEASGQSIPCQVLRQTFPAHHVTILSAVFPVSVGAGERKLFRLKEVKGGQVIASDLTHTGEGVELQIENSYYWADLTRSPRYQAKSHHSGQLKALRIKMGFDILLFRTENRMHWAPNFKKKGLPHYTTIAAWENPRVYRFEQGPYMIRTLRQDLAPGHPEILLSATYQFYAYKPYFLFYSAMEVSRDLWLELLRNDEMTMDSLFTHVAFRRPNGEIRDLPFSTRHEILEKDPLADDAPWLCFYHRDRHYAFGSIRLRYDNHDLFGNPSPTYHPHTKISDGAGGGKYWNRRLIDEHPTFVPQGSRYVEKNAYLVFRIAPPNKFAVIEQWARQLRNPLQVTVLPGSDE